MKKILPIFVVLMLVFGGLGALAFNVDKKKIYDNETILVDHSEESLVFSEPDLVLKEEGYLSFSLKDDENFLINPGKPLVPRIVRTYELPFGVKDVNIDVMVDEVSELDLEKEIVPSPQPMPLSDIQGYVPFEKKDMSVYNSNDLFPSSWYSYNVGCGMNSEGEHVTFVNINIYPYRYRPVSGKLIFAEKADIDISYTSADNDIFPTISEYDMVIITPKLFKKHLEKLAEHKNTYGVSTIIKTTDEIYDEYTGRDAPEQIKYFIKDALETWGIKYVLLVGGLKSQIHAPSRDDINQGTRWWYLPVRYSNLISGEPGYVSDIYYADIYKEGGLFEDWDSSGNNIFAEWPDDENGETADTPIDFIDLYPDVALGRLACRNSKEVKDCVNKIIEYETQNDDSWFKKMVVISGDGFLDQLDLNFQWDTTGLPDGEYTIYAQSNNPEGTFGPIDEIAVTLDKGADTDINFNHDDHLKTDTYPFDPIAEIVSVSPGDVLGKDDYTYEPHGGQAYCNDLFWWANISYVGGVLTIRGKSYDPKPYGNLSDIHVWVENSEDVVVFDDWRYDTPTFYEGEWVTGEKEVNGRAGALYYMPEDFDFEKLWTSNGGLTGQQKVIDVLSEGQGFVFFSGHGSPGVWGDQTPGIPGNRQHSWVTGLDVSEVLNGFPFIEFPMKKIKNNGKYPVVVVGGCHNSMFNVSLILSIMDRYQRQWMHTYGRPVPECWGWYLVKLPKTGAIATMGNTGFGWGWEGEFCTIGGGDGWLTSEFFRQYGENNLEILGDAYQQAVVSYVSNFKSFTMPQCYWSPDLGWDWIDEKSAEQWVLLGDPSLKMGGY